MIRMLAAISVALALALPLAHAQSPRTGNRTEIAQGILRVCLASSSRDGVVRSEAGCACTIGVMSARATDRQFYLIGRSAPYLFRRNEVQNLEAELLAEGFTNQDFDQVADLISSATQVSDATCWSLGGSPT